MREVFHEVIHISFTWVGFERPSARRRVRNQIHAMYSFIDSLNPSGKTYLSTNLDASKFSTGNSRRRSWKNFTI